MLKRSKRVDDVPRTLGCVVGGDCPVEMPVEYRDTELEDADDRGTDGNAE
jgi:prolyl-tRNA editing enzyme YbaK/EbsC (Cys-tRNA(Pro) deacylase)